MGGLACPSLPVPWALLLGGPRGTTHEPSLQLPPRVSGNTKCFYYANKEPWGPRLRRLIVPLEAPWSGCADLILGER